MKFLKHVPEFIVAIIWLALLTILLIRIGVFGTDGKSIFLFATIFYLSVLFVEFSFWRFGKFSNPDSPASKISFWLYLQLLPAAILASNKSEDGTFPYWSLILSTTIFIFLLGALLIGLRDQSKHG